MGPRSERTALTMVEIMPNWSTACRESGREPELSVQITIKPGGFTSTKAKANYVPDRTACSSTLAKIIRPAWVCSVLVTATTSVALMR